MMSLDRRIDYRVPLEMFLNAYVADEPQRGFTMNVSETGLLLASLAIRDPVPPMTTVGLEFKLPGFSETIWAAGEICYDTLDDFFLGQGIRFTAMAGLHTRILREYCLLAKRSKRRFIVH